MAAPTADYYCQGSEHGTTYRGWGGAIYTGVASPLACSLSDRDSAFPPYSQRITRRRWVKPKESWRGIDETGARFY